jgi:hypothetical protein
MQINKRLREKYIEIIITRKREKTECVCDRQPPKTNITTKNEKQTNKLKKKK